MIDLFTVWKPGHGVSWRREVNASISLLVYAMLSTLQMHHLPHQAGRHDMKLCIESSVGCYDKLHTIMVEK